jgi:hypothetical protein
MLMDGFGDTLYLWRMLIVYFALLAAYLILLCVAVAGFIAALQKQEQSRKAGHRGC